jgi:hypothetical protein
MITTRKGGRDSMIIYGVFYQGPWDEELQNLYMSKTDAETYVASRNNPDEFFVTEMRVY